MGDMGTPGSRNSMWESFKEVTLDAECDTLEVMTGSTMQLDFWLFRQHLQPKGTSVLVAAVS